MQKKLLILILAILGCLACVFGVTACDSPDSVGNTGGGNVGNTNNSSGNTNSGGNTSGGTGNTGSNTNDTSNTENTYGFVYADYGNCYAITSYTGTEKNLSIPAMYKGKKVIAVGNIDDAEAQRSSLSEQNKLERGGFYKNREIESIILPNTIEYINAYAFMGCTNLKSVNLNEGLTHIGLHSFNNTNVTTLKIPSTVNKINGLQNSKVETLEFSKPSYSHITEFFGCYKQSMIDLETRQICYWSGEIDSHFQVTSTKSEVVASSAGVQLSVDYPNSYKLVNYWFTHATRGMLFLYGEYKIYTKQVKVATAGVEREYYTYFSCPDYIIGDFYLLPASLKNVVVNGECNQTFVKDLDVQLIVK